MILAVIAVGATVPPAGPAAADAGVNVIIGPDGRFPVSPTTAFPASATVLVTFAGGRCTGFMIGESTVAVPGHCVHSGGSGGTWRTNVVAYPGHDGMTAPYGSCTARSLHVSQEWTVSPGNPANDYGAVKLNCTVGRTTGWFNLSSVQSPVDVCTTTHGYPVDRPGQWASRDYIRNATTTLFYVQHDSVGGQAGSPIFYNGTTEPDDWCPTPRKPPVPPRTVLGFMTAASAGGFNVGIRITPPVLNNLNNWNMLP